MLALLGTGMLLAAPWPARAADEFDAPPAPLPAPQASAPPSPVAPAGPAPPPRPRGPRYYDGQVH